jgi:hypothetical protein
MTTNPSVWILHESGLPQRRLTEAELAGFFHAHDKEPGGTPFPSFERLYRLMDCHTVERLVLPGLGTLWCDENGGLCGRPVNPVGTALAQVAYRSEEVGVVGTAVLVVDPGTDDRFVEGIQACRVAGTWHVRYDDSVYGGAS